MQFLAKIIVCQLTQKMWFSFFSKYNCSCPICLTGWIANHSQIQISAKVIKSSHLTHIFSLFQKDKEFCPEERNEMVCYVCAKVCNGHTSYLSFFYTHTFSGLKILHSKVRKFATKIVSRENSVNHHSRANFHIYVFQCVKL